VEPITPAYLGQDRFDDLAGILVVVADPDAMVRHVLDRILRRHGALSDPLDLRGLTRALCARRCPTVLVLDPAGDANLMLAVRHAWPLTPVILTGDPGLSVQSIQPASILEKPVDFALLVKLVRELSLK